MASNLGKVSLFVYIQKSMPASFPILAHCVNSVSSLALYFGYRLALDFGLDHMQLVN